MNVSAPLWVRRTATGRPHARCGNGGDDSDDGGRRNARLKRAENGKKAIMHPLGLHGYSTSQFTQSTVHCTSVLRNEKSCYVTS